MVNAKFETVCPVGFHKVGQCDRFRMVFRVNRGFEQVKNGHWRELIHGMSAKRPNGESYQGPRELTGGTKIQKVSKHFSIFARDSRLCAPYAEISAHSLWIYCYRCSVLSVHFWGFLLDSMWDGSDIPRGGTASRVSRGRNLIYLSSSSRQGALLDSQSHSSISIL
jgi:hypothetical protein